MKRLAVVLFLLAAWACPGMLHASSLHPKPRKATPHHTAGHASARHYTEKAQRHAVVQRVPVGHYTRKAHVDRAARHAHKKHKKVG